jgi:hypothetical protein
MTRMNTLGTDELMLIMIQMKTQYEREYQLLEQKHRALMKAAKEHGGLYLYHNDVCSCCNGVCYLGRVALAVSEFDAFDGEAYDHDVDNYVVCIGCKKVCCDECWQLKEDGRGDGFVIEHCVCEATGTANVWRCKTCNDFHENMKTLK